MNTKYKIYCDRGNGPELDGCWGSEDAIFTTREEAEAAIPSLAKMYPDVKWSIVEEMENNEKTVQERLLDAIKAHSGMEEEEIKSAGEHGADAGWSGFIYTGDTVRFYDANKDAIWELLREESESGGSDSVVGLIASFQCSKSMESPDSFANGLAWFTLEEVGHWLTMRDENAKTEEAK